MRRREKLTLVRRGRRGSPQAEYVTDPGNAPVMRVWRLRDMIGTRDRELDPRVLELYADTERPTGSDYIEIRVSSKGLYRWRDILGVPNKWSGWLMPTDAFRYTIARLTWFGAHSEFFLWVVVLRDGDGEWL